MRGKSPPKRRTKCFLLPSYYEYASPEGLSLSRESSSPSNDSSYSVLLHHWPNAAVTITAT